MIKVIDRKELLSDPERYVKMPCVIFAAVAGDDVEEPGLSEAWLSLREMLNGVGARIGYRTFMTLSSNSEEEIQNIVPNFSATKSENCNWRFVAAPICNIDGTLTAIKEAEWQANKNAQNNKASILQIISGDNTWC